jgi:hypothetical protein
VGEGAEWAETLRILESGGYGGVWSAEHHFFWDGWTNPMPTNPVMFGAFAKTTEARPMRGLPAGLAPANLRRRTRRSASTPRSG